jgi:hypothetical protein
LWAAPVTYCTAAARISVDLRAPTGAGSSVTGATPSNGFVALQYASSTARHAGEDLHRSSIIFCSFFFAMILWF